MHSLGLEYHDVVAGDEFDSSGFPGAASASFSALATASSMVPTM